MTGSAAASVVLVASAVREWAALVPMASVGLQTARRAPADRRARAATAPVVPRARARAATSEGTNEPSRTFPGHPAHCVDRAWRWVLPRLPVCLLALEEAQRKPGQASRRNRRS